MKHTSLISRPKSKLALPLTGVRVLDLSRILAGPFCTMRLGDMGAEVIKIEQPGTGDETRRWGPPFINGESAYFLSINRNKRSVTLDFKSNEGRLILLKLIKTSDVLVENFRVGIMKKLGLDYPAIKKINPRLVYCSISGYGQKSKRSHKPSYDLIIQGESGLMDITGFPENPPTKTGISLADINAGTLAFAGIVLALYQRERTGKGRHIDISLLDATLSLFAFQSQIVLSTSTRVKRRGNLHPTLAPYQTFRTKDGYINIAVVNDVVWKSFCRAIGQKILSADKQFTTNAKRVKNRPILDSILEPIIKKKSSVMWDKIFSRSNVPAGRINTLPEALMLEPGMISTVHHLLCGSLRMVGNPVKLSDTAATRALPPPLLGEHTVEVLKDLGYSNNEIKLFRTRQAI